MLRARQRRSIVVARPKKAETALSPSMRESAEILAAAGMTDEMIARSIGVPLERLREYDDLIVGAARRNAKMVLALYRAGVNGNVTAQRAWLARAEVADLVPRKKPESQERKVRKRPLGKKEVAEIEANEIPHDSEWADILH